MHFDDRYWIGGEWIAPYEPFEEFDSNLERLEYKAQLRFDHPKASDIAFIPIFHALLDAAENCFEATGRHLDVYGEIGELYGAIAYGIRLDKLHASGADGRMGDDHVEIKTITPISKGDTKMVKRSGGWNKVLLVKIDESFNVRGYLLDKKSLVGKGKQVRLKWDESLADDGLTS